MNTFYGVLGDSSSQLYNPLMAGSITEKGRFLLNTVKKYCEDYGLIPQQGDTDSLYLIAN